MQKKTASIVIIPFIIFLGAVFYSCENSVTPGETYEHIEWSMFDSTSYNSVYKIQAADINNLFIIGGNRFYKVSGGVSTQIGFNDPEFIPVKLKVYNAEYAAVFGWDGFEFADLKIKIYNNGNLSEFTFANFTHAMFLDFIIIEPGKILLQSPQGLLLWHNGLLKNIPSPENFGVNWLNGFTSVDNKVYVYGNTGEESKIYKFENDSLIFFQNTSGYQIHFNKIKNKIVRSYTSGNENVYQFLSGNEWITFFNYPVKYLFQFTGDDTDFLYLHEKDAAFGNFSGSVKSRSSVFPDYNIPVKDSSGTSKMNDGVIFMHKNTSSKAYIYKGIRKTGIF